MCRCPAVISRFQNPEFMRWANQNPARSIVLKTAISFLSGRRGFRNSNDVSGKRTAGSLGISTQQSNIFDGVRAPEVVMYACGKWRNGRSKGCIFTFICEHFLGNFLGIRYRLKPRTRETRRFVLAGHLARTRLAEGPIGPVGFRKHS